ncbi:MAG: hypothetical protein QOE65_2183 [Solirubrobacteraceae bacterium]|jgi:hypothetical protein|nr:hypothetical protein [Solirubrobacteraceae bacterium]
MKISKTLVTVAAMLAVTLTLAAAAQAQPAGNGTPGKKGCTVNMQNPDGSPGQSIVYDDGYSFSIKNKSTGKTHTYKCNDGKWEETVARAGGSRWQRITYIGAFQINPSGRGRLRGERTPAAERRYSAMQ